MPQAVFIPWKRPSGRSSGQPATLDCSGNAGIVAGGDGFGRNDWIVAGSGLGRPGKVGKRIEKKKKKKTKKVKIGFRDILVQKEGSLLCEENVMGYVCVCVEGEEGGGGSYAFALALAFAFIFMMLDWRCERP